MTSWASQPRRDAGGAWSTADNAVLPEGKRLLIDDARRFGGVNVIRVGEHVWRHTRRR